MANKVPTRSPTHEDIEMRRLSSMGLELEEIADGDDVQLSAIIELAEDRGRPTSHYLAAIPLATSLTLGFAAKGERGPSSGSGLKLVPSAPITVRVCAGTCQRWGALDILDALVDRWAVKKDLAILPVTCLDRCDHAAACEIDGAHGKLVVAPATPASLNEALDTLLH